MYPLALPFATVVFLTQHVLSARSSTDRHRLLLLRNIYVTYTYATWIAISAVRWAPMLAISTRFISFPLNFHHSALLFHNRSTSPSHFSSCLFIVLIIFLFLLNAFSLSISLSFVQTWSTTVRLKHSLTIDSNRIGDRQWREYQELRIKSTRFDKIVTVCRI